MDNTPVTHYECDKLCKGLEKADENQNAIIAEMKERMDKMDDQIHQIYELTVSVRELTVEVHTMGEKVGDQSERLRKIESRDGEKYRDIWKIVVTALVGIGLGALAVLIGVN